MATNLFSCNFIGRFIENEANKAVNNAVQRKTDQLWAIILDALEIGIVVFFVWFVINGIIKFFSHDD